MRLVTAFITLLVLAAGAATLSADPAPSASPAAPAAAPEMAVFSVPRLGKGSMIKDLLKVLADKPGVVSAKPDKRREQLRVTFVPGETSPQAILRMLVTVAKDARLDAVTAADPRSAATHDCSRCPASASCGKAK